MLEVRKAEPNDKICGVAKRYIADGEIITITILGNGVWTSDAIEFYPPYSEPTDRG